MRKLLDAIVACALLLAAGAQAADATTRPPPPAAPEVKCVLVRDAEFPEHPFILRDRRPRQFAAEEETCAGQAGLYKAGRLTGAGDIELTLTQEDYRRAVEDARAGKGSLTLFVNGVPLPGDGELVSAVNRGADTALRYRINQGPDTQGLWAMLYRQQGLLGTDNLRAGLGWTLPGTATATFVLPPSEPASLQGGAGIEITSPGRATSAALVLAILLACLYFVAFHTDALRDAPLPAWWKRAQDLRASVTRLQPAQQDALLRKHYPDYDPGRRADYEDAATRALGGMTVSEAEEADAGFGLALRRAPWEPVRASFSLSRTQMALWFAFAISAGLFLWIVYGQLRKIDHSVLVLLGLSVGTAGVSLSVDRNAGGRDYLASKGLFTDLVTGFDDKQQVHRYQAVVVNLLLLFVGISHVLQHLAYPIFEPTWLALLGVSGLALGVGKQAVEQKPGAAPTPPAARPAGTAAPALGDGSVG